MARNAEFVSENTRTELVVARRMRLERGMGLELLVVVVVVVGGAKEGSRSEEGEEEEREGGDQRRLTSLERREGRSKLWTRSRVEVLRTDRCVVWRVAMCRPSGEGTEGWVELMRVEASISKCDATLEVLFRGVVDV